MKEIFHITVEYINKKNPNEGYAIYCHSNINGIGMEFYELDKEKSINLIKKNHKIDKVIDYTLEKD